MPCTCEEDDESCDDPGCTSLDSNYCNDCGYYYQACNCGE